MIEIPKGLDRVIKTNDHGPLKSIVYMYRNKWNHDTAKYEVENTPVNITKWLTKAANLVLQLDLAEINRYDASNITLTFANAKNEFAEDVEGSFFPEGYLLYGSKFEYYVGVSDDLKVLMYTGTIAEEPTYKTENYEVDIRVVSQLELFKKKECSSFANQAAGEKLVGTYPHYTTVNIGVGNVLKVYAGTPTAIQEELILGVDYTLDGLNEMLSSASIEIINSNLNGKTFYADYYYWKTNLKIHKIVHGLLDIMKIPQDKRYVEEVIFNTSVKNQFVGTSQTVGLGYYKEGDNDYKFNWLPTRDGVWQNYSAPRNYIPTYRQSIYPKNFEVNFTVRVDDFNGAWASGFHCAQAIGNTVHSSQIVANGMYIVGLRRDNIGIPARGIAFELRQRSNGGGSTLWASGTYLGIDFIEIAFKIRKVNGVWTVFAGNQQIAQWTQEIEVNLDALFCTARQGWSTLNFNVTPLDASGVATSSAVFNPSLLSHIIDKGNDSDVWGQYTCNLDGSGFIYSLRYATSQDGISFGPWQNVDINTNIGSTDRYIKYWFSLINAPSFSTNILNLVYTYLSNNLNMNFVNLADKTILEGMEDLALISGYEFGFTRNNTFFFKQRIKSTEAIKVLTDNEIIKVSTVKKNLNTLFTKIQLNFGGIPVEVYANDFETTRPTLQDRYGILTKSIDKPDILNYDNPELAHAIAPQLLEVFGILKNNINVTATLDLALDLGEIISLRRNSPLTVDKNAPDHTKYERTQTFYKACKIIGMNYNLKDRQMAYTLLDVTNENTAPEYEANKFKYLFPVAFGARR